MCSRRVGYINMTVFLVGAFWYFFFAACYAASAGFGVFTLFNKAVWEKDYTIMLVTGKELLKMFFFWPVYYIHDVFTLFKESSS